MKIRPLRDRILVTRVAAPEVGRHGLIIPDTAQEKPRRAQSSRWGTAR